MSERINNKIFGFFENTTLNTSKTSTMITSTTSTVKPTTTSTLKPTVQHISVYQDNSEVIETINSLKNFLVIVTVLIGLIVIYKIIKLCRQGYKIHNDRIINRHQNSSERL